jgi:hypothetical protein
MEAVRLNLEDIVLEPPSCPTQKKPVAHTPPSFGERAPEPGFLFPGRQADYHQNQLRDFSAKVDLQIAQENYAAKMEINARSVDHELTEQPKRLAQETEVRDLTHRQTIEQTQATHDLNVNVLIPAAKDKTLDVPTLMVVRVEEERSRIALEAERQKVSIEVDKVRQLEDNRLYGYEREARIDIQAALGMHLKSVETIDYVGYKIERLRAENANPDRIKVLERIRDQMEKRLLEAPEQEGLGGIDPAPEGEAGS